MSASYIQEMEFNIQEVLQKQSQMRILLAQLREQEKSDNASIKHFLEHLEIQRSIMERQLQQQLEYREELENQMNKLLSQ